MVRIMKTAPMPTTASTRVLPGALTRIAEANSKNTKIRPLQGIAGYCYAIKSHLVTQEWLSLSDEVPTSELRDVVKDMVMNFGVVSALLFTMVSLSAGECGDELVKASNGSITQELTDSIYIFSSALAFMFFIGNVLFSLHLYLILSECNNHDETVIWRSIVGNTALNIPFLLLLAGGLSYVFSHFWLYLTIMPLGWWIPIIVIAVVFLCILGHFTINTVKALYNAKWRVAQGERAPNYSEEDNAVVDSLMTENGALPPAKDQ